MGRRRQGPVKEGEASPSSRAKEAELPASPQPASGPPSQPAQLPSQLAAKMTDEQHRIFKVLMEIGQSHLFTDDFFREGNDSKALALLDQVSTLDKSYPGGLAAYVKNAKKLLQESRDGVNPFGGYKPEVPEGINVTFPSPKFTELEKIGMGEVGQCAIVLVAGGLGERLGYSGIKIELPVQTVTGTCFLEHYLQNLKALAEESGAKAPIPLAIMTSGDTNKQTEQLLAESKCFGYPQEAVTIIKQEKVPSISDNNGSFVLASPFELDTKPHGHGDVHSLLHSSGLAKKWVSEGRKWVAFIQDTNPMVFNTLPATLGTSVEKDFEVNSICIPRKPKEAIGGIAKLTGKRPLTINVEYNQLEPLLLDATGKGDIADPATGFSPFPGNINTLVFRLPEYAKVLEETQGQMPEFVNPKYKDAEKTSFKKPTRLECMMQDYPRLLGPGSKVGFTTFDRWFSFSPVKNNVVDAKDKVKDGVPACASSGEADVYFMGCERLRAAGVNVAKDPSEKKFLDIPVKLHPRVVLSASFAASEQQLKQRIRPSADITIAGGSTVVLDGHIEIEHLNVAAGSGLRVKVPAGSSLLLRRCNVSNEGCHFNELTDEQLKAAPEQIRMRGYTTVWKGCEHIEVPSEGQWVYDSDQSPPLSRRQAAPAAEAVPTPAAPAAKAMSPPAPPQRVPPEPPAKRGKKPSDPSLKFGVLAAGAAATWFMMSKTGEATAPQEADKTETGAKAKL